MSTFLRQFLREFEDYTMKRRNMRAILEDEDEVLDDEERRPKYIYKRDAVEI